MNSGRKARNIKTNKLPLEITGEKVDRPKRNLKETNQKLITSIRQAILSSNTEELGALLDSATEEPIQVDFGGVSGSFKLERIDLRKIHIIGMTLNEKHELTEIKFGALTNCRFTNTTLTGCTFHGTTKEMVLVNCKGEGNSFTGEHFNLEMTNICRAFFRQPVSPHRAAGDKQFGSVKPSFGESAKCPFAIWNGDFVDVNLQNVSLGGCHLIQTKLSGVFSG
ncbi:MAG: pentapeptide repeat-containing protein, partial [bacterium]